jgi:hypothetical protein
LKGATRRELVGMFWKKSGRESPEQEPAESNSGPGPIHIDRDAERSGTILKVAGELESRGAEVVELFKVIDTYRGKAILPIHLLWRNHDYFIEIETRPWKSTSVEKALDDVAILRSSDYAGAGLGLLSAYPVPDEVNYFFGRSPLALFQLQLYTGRLESPEARADLFVDSAERHLDKRLPYRLESVSSTEDLLTDTFNETEEPDPDSAEALPILDALAESLGCYVGEVIRRNASGTGAWTKPETSRADALLEIGDFVLDPIGNARAFLKNGQEDSIAYYAGYVLRQLSGNEASTGSDD